MVLSANGLQNIIFESVSNFIPHFSVKKPLIIQNPLSIILIASTNGRTIGMSYMLESFILRIRVFLFKKKTTHKNKEKN